MEDVPRRINPGEVLMNRSLLAVALSLPAVFGLTQLSLAQMPNSQPGDAGVQIATVDSVHAGAPVVAAADVAANAGALPGELPLALEPQSASGQVPVLAALPASSAMVPAPNAVAPVASASQSVVAPPGFWKALFKAYYDDWHPGPGTPDPPKYRGDPMPTTNPPFPFTMWPMGGTVLIGYPNATSYPITQALQNGRHGDWWKKKNIQIYGWADLGMNLSTSSGRPYGNLPAAYSEVPNTFQLDQAALYIERTPDTIQTDHFDWGFRFTNLYGLDYRYTTAQGYFSGQLLNSPQKDGSMGQRLGYDPVMMYVDLYFPHIGQGTDVRMGRYVSLPDIEAQLAPNNYTYSHSLTYVYDCYTQTGINATTKWTNHWTTQVGFSAGCESAPWAPSAKPTANVCVAYSWHENGDNIYVCANSINDSKYNYNNLAAYYLTWYHKFGHSKWHTDWETWYQYMKDTPNVNNPAAASLLVNNSDGAFCNTATQLTCYAPEWATLNYVARQIGKDSVTLRNEFLDDIKGQRTGFQTKYSEHDIGWNHWIGTTIVFRPEVRYDHSYQAPAYDNGTKKSQLMFAADMIWFY